MGKLLILGGVLLVVLFVMASIGDSQEMAAKKKTFYAACLAERKQYDCDLQWETFAAAHSAEISATAAQAQSGAAMAMSAGK